MDTKAKIGLIVLVAVIAACVLFLWHFLPIEGCLDLGGVWDYEASKCIESQALPAAFEAGRIQAIIARSIAPPATHDAA